MRVSQKSIIISLIAIVVLGIIGCLIGLLSIKVSLMVVLALACLLLQFKYPIINLIVLLILIPLPLNITIHGINLEYSIVYFAIICIYQMIISRSQLNFTWERIDWIPFSYLVIGILPLFHSLDIIEWVKGYVRVFLLPVMFYFYIKKSNYPTTKLVKSSLIGTLLSVVLISIYSLIQFFFFSHLHLDFVGDAAYKETDTVLSQGNALAMYIERGIPYFIFIFLNLKHLNLKKYQTVFLIVSSIIVFLTLILSLSRGAWITFVCILLLILIFRRKLKLVLIVLIVAIVAGTVIPPIRIRLFTDLSTLLFRGELWDASFKVIRSNFLTGIPLDDFHIYYHKYIAQNLQLSRSHNIFLDFILFMGIFGLIWFAYFLYRLTCDFINNRRKIEVAKNFSYQIVFYGYFIVIISMLIHGLIDSPHFSYSRDMLFWMGFAIFHLVIKDSNEQSHK